MNLVKEKLLTIVTEADLEDHLIKDVNKLGAKGYTITQATGRGVRGIRNNLWGPSSNIKVEIVCNEDIASKIIVFLEKNYLKNYAIMVFLADIEVMLA